METVACALVEDVVSSSIAGDDLHALIGISAQGEEYHLAVTRDALIPLIQAAALQSRNLRLLASPNEPWNDARAIPADRFEAGVAIGNGDQKTLTIFGPDGSEFPFVASKAFMIDLWKVLADAYPDD